MPAKQHLNFHGTVSTFVRQFHPSLTGAPVLALPTAFNSSNRAFYNERDQCCQKGSRSRCSLAWKKTGCPELVRNRSEGLVVLVNDLRF